MSRIGKQPVPIAPSVKVEMTNGGVSIKGPLGQLEWKLAEGMTVKAADGALFVQRAGNTPREKALHGLTQVELKNIVHGVTSGYERILELTGVGYRAQVQGQSLTLSVGFAHPVSVPIPPGIQVVVEKQTVVSLRGVDKRLVSQVAANIKSVRPPDVYKQKGIKYAGEVLIKKAGKAGKK